MFIDGNPQEEEVGQKFLNINFRVAIMCPTFAMILVSTVAFVVLALLAHNALHGTLNDWSSSNADTLRKWKDAVVNAQDFAVKEVLHQVDREIDNSFIIPPNEAVDTLSGAIRTKHNKENWNFTTVSQLREGVEIRAWEALGNQWNCPIVSSKACRARADSLYASFESGGFAGGAFASVGGMVDSRRLFYQEADKTLEIWQVQSNSGFTKTPVVLRPGFQPKEQPFYDLSFKNKRWSPVYLLRPWVNAADGDEDARRSDCVRDPNWYRPAANVGEWGGVCKCPNGARYEVGDNRDNCASLACEGGTVEKACGKGNINSANAGYKVTCNQYIKTASENSSNVVMTMSRTSPIIFNNVTSGVVAADISLKVVSDKLFDQWKQLSIELEDKWSFKIEHDTSSVFIVNQVSIYSPAQEGCLLGASNQSWWNAEGSKNCTNATESSIQIVADASRAILLRYGSWYKAGLQPPNRTVFYFSVRALRSGVLRECDPLQRTPDLADCMQVATHTIKLDIAVRWLIVAALPSEAYFKTYNEKVMETAAGIDGAQQEANTSTNTINTVCILILVASIIFACLVALATSILVMRPLSSLGRHMERLSHLEFAHGTEEYKKLQEGGRGRVHEVKVLRDGFCRLSQSMETFAKFVPETVVRRLVCADEHKRNEAAMLSLRKRNVTIMFSDIAGFTTISEDLSQRDLLFLLTFYLTEMTRIIQSFEGVVGEVLGDGLLCYWNTPHVVENHACKACAAALAQQKQLVDINARLAEKKLPQLRVRIGLHTGEVLSGNLGTMQSKHGQCKLKFGCMGDAVDLASHLEELCKAYGVGILCSEATRAALPPEFGIRCRRLDSIQVKGKMESTLIHEVIGCDRPESGLEPIAPAHIWQAQAYEEALDAHQTGKFDEAVRILETLHQAKPEDVAVAKLLERARGELNMTTRPWTDPKTPNRTGFWDFLRASSKTSIPGEELS
jgi:class 3 adenylate cyclase